MLFSTTISREQKTLVKHFKGLNCEYNHHCFYMRKSFDYENCCFCIQNCLSSKQYKRKGKKRSRREIANELKSFFMYIREKDTCGSVGQKILLKKARKLDWKVGLFTHNQGVAQQFFFLCNSFSLLKIFVLCVGTR